MNKTLRILGTRGVPAAHGGFETFAEHLALYLVKQGWRVIVYCQEDATGDIYEDVWKGVERVHIPVEQEGPKGTIIFDWKATVHAAKFGDLCLTLGYNTAIFCTLFRLKGVPNIINMDGIEWQRGKWGAVAKAWFYVNDWLGCWLGNHLVADHPLIAEHLKTRVNGKKITIIPYGSDEITSAPEEPVRALGLEPGKYFSLIARPEPENSILEVVTGFSLKRRGYKLLILGNFKESNPYHQAVKAAASGEVVFVGAIYDQEVVQALRFHSVAYIHGHQVGGTNPSLVEAMGAGNAVIANDNFFNRWVAGETGCYFKSAEDFSQILDRVIGTEGKLEKMRAGIFEHYHEKFTWDHILFKYEILLTKWLPSNRSNKKIT